MYKNMLLFFFLLFSEMYVEWGKETERAEMQTQRRDTNLQWTASSFCFRETDTRPSFSSLLYFASLVQGHLKAPNSFSFYLLLHFRESLIAQAFLTLKPGEFSTLLLVSYSSGFFVSKSLGVWGFSASLLRFPWVEISTGLYNFQDAHATLVVKLPIYALHIETSSV